MLLCEKLQNKREGSLVNRGFQKTILTTIKRKQKLLKTHYFRSSIRNSGSTSGGAVEP